MLDGGHAGADGALHTFVAVGVGGHLAAVVPGRLDDGADLFFGELRSRAVVGDGEHAAGGRDLDVVAAAFDGNARGPVRCVWLSMSPGMQ